MLCLICWAVDVRATGGLAGSAQGATRRFCFIRARACCPHAVSTRIPRLTLPRPSAMLLVSGSVLDRTCPGARRSLSRPKTGPLTTPQGSWQLPGPDSHGRRRRAYDHEIRHGVTSRCHLPFGWALSPDRGL